MASCSARVRLRTIATGWRASCRQAQPRKLLGTVEGLELVEMKDADVCCGFGGTFAVKFGEISGQIVDRKTQDILATQAPVLLAGDLGCLMNMAGRLSRKGRDMEVRHVAEVLANMTDEAPPIGEAAGYVAPETAE